MSDREHNDLTPEEERARRAVRELPPVAADPAFRERLKADFVSGRLVEASDHPTHPGDGTRHPGRAPRRFGPTPRRAWRVIVPVVAAVLAIFLFNRGPALELADVTGTGTITVDGRGFESTDRSGLERAIRPGSRIELAEGVAIEVLYEDTAVYQIVSAATTLPGAPRRWLGRSSECRLERGELQVLTGSRFRGAGLRIETPEGRIDVTGTLLSVVRDDSGTCVCVHHGKAQVGIDENDLEEIGAGQRKVMFADGQAPIITPIAPPHAEHLTQFEAKYRAGIR
jgi:ferric-dicitrate binding protein FerR (iron transport regulator)